jgi:hypothetical protein
MQYVFYTIMKLNLTPQCDPVKTAPTLQFTKPAPALDVLLDEQIPVITVMGDDEGDKTTMIAATLARALNDLGKHVLYYYFDEAAHLQSRDTTLDTADLVVVACPRASHNRCTKWLINAHIRLLLTYDMPFGITHAYAEIKNANEKLSYEDLVVNTVDSGDGNSLHLKLCELVNNNHLPCKLHYLGSLTLQDDIAHRETLLSFEGETASALRQVAEQLLVSLS